LVILSFEVRENKILDFNTISDRKRIIEMKLKNKERKLKITQGKK